MLTSILRTAMTRSFKPFVFRGEYDNSLDFEALPNLGLYVHIPFCRSICSFCPYCKQPFEADIASDYAAALLKEIDLVCCDMTEKKQVTSLYFGGGTPALMIDYIPDIINRISEYFDITGGIGIELHPYDITEQTLEKIKSCGVTMLSVGIQSFDRVCLEHLGRTGGTGFAQKLELIKTYSFDVLDVDLIFGIPGQTEKTLEADIKTAFGCGATQVSTYPFIDFTFASNEYKPLSHGKKKRMLKRLSEICDQIGAVRTSVWTFARPETEKYSSVTRETFLGFGVSAASLLKNQFKINTFSVLEYIKRINAGQMSTSLTLRFSLRQRAVYSLFWSAYGMEINCGDFKKLMGKSVRKMFGLTLLSGRLSGLIKKHGSSYRLTKKGAMIYHRIEQTYTTAYIDKMWNVCRKTAFPDEIVLK